MVFAVIQVAIFYLILQYLFNGYRVMLRVKNDMLVSGISFTLRRNTIVFLP